MEYPTFEPSSRAYSHGKWPVSRHKFMTGRSQQILHANGKGEQRLQVRYDNRPLEDFDYFLAHFNENRGTHTGFYLNSSVMYAGWDGIKGTNNDDRRFGFGLKWRYSKPPRIRSQRGMYGTLEVELETVAATDTFYQPPGVPEECLPYPIPSGGGGPIPITPGKPGDGGGSSNDPGNGPPDGGGPNPDPAPGPDGPDPDPSPGPGPGEPIPIPEPEPEPPIPDIDLPAGTGFTFHIQNRDVGAIYSNASCVNIAFDDQEDSRCGNPYYNYKGCGTARSNYSIWPLTFSKVREAVGTKYILEPAPEAGTYPYGSSGCYSRDQISRNYNRKGTYVPNPDYIDAAWVWTDATGVARAGTGSTRRGYASGCEDGFNPTGDENERSAEITRIVVGATTVWQSPRYLNNIACRDWYGDNPIDRQTGERLTDISPFNGSVNFSLDRSVAPRVKNSVLDNNYFPNISPSRRRIIFGDYEVDRYGSDQEVTMPLPSTAQKNDVVMTLVYANRRDEIARMFMDHYDQCSGEFYDFPLAPVNKQTGTFAGWDDPDTKNIHRGRWIYRRPPRIDQTAIGHSTTTIEILNLSPALTDPDAGSDGNTQGPAVPPPPTEGPGTTPTPEPKPPFGFIPDGQGGFIPNPEQTGAFLRLLRWTNRTQPAYVTTYASCTEGEIGPAETWSGTYVEGPYYMDTNYENVRNESKTWLLSEPSSWKWVDGTSGQRTIVNGQKVTSEVTAGVTTQQYGLRGTNGYPYSDPCASRATVEVPDSCITREGAIDGNQTDGTCDVCFLPDDWEDQMSEKYGATWKVDYTTNEQKYLMAKEFCDIDNQGRPDL